MQAINIQLLHPDAVMPAKAHPSDACFDVVAVSRRITPDFVAYGLGFASQLPEGWEAVVRPRSSISKMDLAMCNAPGTIDAGYTGEWEVRFSVVAPFVRGFDAVGIYNEDKLPTGWVPSIYSVGQRVAQIQFQRVPDVQLVQVDELAPSQRGTGGFGSTGS